MANWSLPTLVTNYSDFLAELAARDVDVAKMFDGTGSNLPTGAIAWSSANNRFEKWNGASYDILTSKLMMNVDQVDGCDVNDTGTSTAILWTSQKIADQLATKQATVTGGASTIVSSNLSANKALISNASGKVDISAASSVELGYLVGVTSLLQGQLDAKAPLASPALTGTPTAPTQTYGNNSTRLATTAFVQAAVGAIDTNLPNFVAGSYMLASSDALAITQSTTMVKLKEGRVGRAGTITVKFSLSSDNAQTVYGRIYKNGIAVGTLRSTHYATPQVYTENISVAANDYIQIYAYSPAATDATVRDFRIFAANPADAAMIP